MKKVTTIVILTMLALLAIPSLVSAVNIQFDAVEIDGRDRDVGDQIRVERGEDIEIVVSILALGDVEDGQIEADISGYRYSHYEEEKVSDTTRTFDLEANDSEEFTLNLQIPVRIDTDYFKLRLRASDRNGASVNLDYQFRVAGVAEEDAVQIKDYHFNPQQVVAGRAFTGTVKVQNYGDDDLEDVSVKVSIPELGISDREYLDELESDETRTFEELLLRIPTCADSARYEVEIAVEFDEFEETMETAYIDVVAGDCGSVTEPTVDKTVITIPQTQEIRKGTTGTAYPVMIKNNGNDAVSYVLTVSGVTFGTYRLEPSSVVVVDAGETKTAYLYVTANDDAPEGDHVFSITVDTDEETQQAVLTANVTAGENVNQGLRKGLEIALIVLVIILIIIGLIVGFMKLREGTANKEDTQTYY